MEIVREPYDRMARNAEKARADGEEGFETLEALLEQMEADEETWEDLDDRMKEAGESR